MQSRSLGSSRCEVRGSYDASGRPHGVTMTSQGHRRCNGIGSSPTLDLSHSSLSKLRQDQRLRRPEAYRVVGLLRGSRPRGRWRCGSGVAASAHRVVGFTLSKVHGLGASDVAVRAAASFTKSPGLVRHQ
ncbi:hypothetical protein NDU88_005376 [Pleurodeles waltl]|uniref:Uncharacterized protein n=1 Tax=Pleurodeles waltl TaxID=8319 RepID=A0AAV7M953_PLEWA|nr:hypothetical protein NDU88_005376 [Pleurodeles waltl]